MEDIESARKKRKLEDGVTASTQNHVTNGDSSVRTSVAAPTRTQSHLQFNPTVIQRLRQITKDCQKNFSPAPKPNGGKLTLGTANTAETTPEKNARTAAADSGDFIISSAGSSPAHSPKPMEFEVLSTPPRPARPTESDTKQAVPIETAQNSNDGRQKACSKLVDRFADLSSNRALINGVSPSMRTLGPDFSSVEVLEEGNQPFCKDSTAKTRVTVNGEVNLQGTTKKNFIHLNSEEQNSPALADVEPTVNAEENGGANYNSEDFRQMVKKMIAERMTQIERSMGVENQERIASLERENTALKEYARKVEDSVKTILAAEKERAKLKVTRAIQTQDPHWLTNLRSTKAVTATPLQSTVTVSRPSSMGLTFTTTPTPRLTSTVAPLPGHTVPSRHENNQLSYRPGLQRPLAEPVRPRIPGTSPRIPQPSVSYVPNYDPGPAGRSEQPDQHGGNRASAPGPNLSSSVHPRLNGVTVRAPTLGAQPPRPVMRMQAPIVSPGGPRSIAPPSSRPLPTVTVHPQTQTPSSVTSVRVQQEPPSYGYANQNAYNSGPPGPRFASAPQVRPQGSQHLQGVPPQISPSHRTPVYPQSPLQASPPQRIMQQQQPMRPEQQNAQIPRPSIQIRAGPPVQMQSSPHAINQQHRSPQPQQPDLARYQSVGGPPRQAIAAHPQPNYGTVSIRQPPPATGGMQPAAVQQPPPPAIVRSSPSAQVKEPPPKPSVSIAVVTSGIVLSWNMVLEEKHAPIMNYQLFALQDGGTAENPHQWKKIGVVKALPLPMACTLTQFLPGNKYHFAVRGTDEMGRLGPFSDPCTITLK